MMCFSKGRAAWPWITAVLTIAVSVGLSCLLTFVSSPSPPLMHLKLSRDIADMDTSESADPSLLPAFAKRPVPSLLRANGSPLPRRWKVFTENEGSASAIRMVTQDMDMVLSAYVSNHSTFCWRDDERRLKDPSFLSHLRHRYADMPRDAFLCAVGANLSSAECDNHQLNTEAHQYVYLSAPQSAFPRAEELFSPIHDMAVADSARSPTIRPVVNFWIGQGGTTAHPHIDFSHNFYTQWAGSKTFQLFSPVTAASDLFLAPFHHPSYRHAQVDFSCVEDNPDGALCANDESKEGLFWGMSGTTIKAQTVTLHAGDSLYIPPFVGHRVLTHGTSGSFSAWSTSAVHDADHSLAASPLPEIFHAAAQTLSSQERMRREREQALVLYVFVRRICEGIGVQPDYFVQRFVLGQKYFPLGLTAKCPTKKRLRELQMQRHGLRQGREGVAGLMDKLWLWAQRQGVLLPLDAHVQSLPHAPVDFITNALGYDDEEVLSTWRDATLRRLAGQVVTILRPYGHDSPSSWSRGVQTLLLSQYIDRVSAYVTSPTAACSMLTNWFFW